MCQFHSDGDAFFKFSIKLKGKLMLISYTNELSKTKKIKNDHLTHVNRIYNQKLVNLPSLIMVTPDLLRGSN